MNARRMEYGAVDLIVDGDDYVAMKRENARLTEQVAALLEVGEAMAQTLGALSVDVDALPEIRQYRNAHLDADPDRDYPVTVQRAWGDYRSANMWIEDWYELRAALAAAPEGRDDE